MGMFDTVICEYPLPLPEEAEGLESPPDWGKIEFQTKSIGDGGDFWGGFMDSYTIEEDGQIYKDVLEREWGTDEEGRPLISEKSNGIEKVDYTGEIVLYAAHMEKKYDYWIEFRVLFWKGDLKEIDLNKWEKTDNSKRRESNKKLLVVAEGQRKRRSSKWHKAGEFIKEPIRLFFYIIKFLIGVIIRLIWWLERGLK